MEGGLSENFSEKSKAERKTLILLIKNNLKKFQKTLAQILLADTLSVLRR